MTSVMMGAIWVRDDESDDECEMSAEMRVMMTSTDDSSYRLNFDVGKKNESHHHN
jgi:hypothetical protein